MTLTIAGAEEAHSYIGQRLGRSEWVEISQRKIDLFAEATGDFQWITWTRPVRRAAVRFDRCPRIPDAQPCTGPASRGVRVEGFSMGLNYGLNKVRFPSPVPVGSRVRLVAGLLDVVPMAFG